MTGQFLTIRFFLPREQQSGGEPCGTFTKRQPALRQGPQATGLVEALFPQKDRLQTLGPGAMGQESKGVTGVAAGNFSLKQMITYLMGRKTGAFKIQAQQMPPPFCPPTPLPPLPWIEPRTWVMAIVIDAEFSLPSRSSWGATENSDRGGLNRTTAVASHVAVAHAIPPFLPLSLDQLQAGDTRDCLAAICRHCDI